MYIYIATCYRVSLIYYYACVFTIKTTHAGFAKILLHKFVDRNVFST